MLCQRQSPGGVLKNLQNRKTHRKHLHQSLFFNKIAGRNFIKKETWYRCFPVNFAKLLRTHFLYNTFGGCFCYASENQPINLVSSFLLREFDIS